MISVHSRASLPNRINFKRYSISISNTFFHSKRAQFHTTETLFARSKSKDPVNYRPVRLEPHRTKSYETTPHRSKLVTTSTNWIDRTTERRRKRQQAVEKRLFSGRAAKRLSAPRVGKWIRERTKERRAAEELFYRVVIFLAARVD